ncbi:FAD-dependent oxidoreductase [Mucilaginibacter achroorhodeus]|uniref:FAD-dependent oxidoreductase n=1 Tax=Mucilaginibacter achroorhodeus TaxID=2599294 RepID=A0A563U7G3_9SPHI|nr:FAD-dependent oxidoreductase [Mucilaginibacter achroorhodeus]TWR27253.1 FAD-dependent oxidoreductase [Mucilaginibacter achroorhodeus]
MANVLIIGGGIIGLSTAYYLQKAGHDVTVLDKGDMLDSCSYGNAGMIVPSHFIPLATPGMLSQGIKWMFNSKSPFYVKPSLNPDLIKWGLKFMKKATADHVERSAVPLTELSLLSKKLYEDLNAEPGFDFDLVEKGILMFYKSEKAAEEEAHLAEKGRELGLDMAVLNVEECKQLQPNLKLDVLGAVHYRCDAHLSPNKLMTALIKYLKASGAKLLSNTEVTKIESDNGKVTAVIAGSQKFTADEYVIAGGSWSPAIAKMLKVNVLLMPGKGYSFNVPDESGTMHIPALLAEARVAITPMNGGLRYGGTMELDAINTRINMNRVKGIVESVPKYFPDLKPAVPEQKDIWFGFRPSSADGLPYIGRTKNYGNLTLATGHGMMGLSLGAATGLLTSEIISGKTTTIKVADFAPDRN